MTLLSRCSEIVVAQINALLDRVEDPEAMLAQIIRELEAGLAAARVHAATAIACERRLYRELAQQSAEMEQWQAAAQQPVASEREDLPRRALARQHELKKAAWELLSQYKAAVGASSQARSALRALETHLATARRTQRSLVTRHRAARARLALHRAAGRRHVQVATLEGKLHHWERRIAELEEEIAAELEVQIIAGAEGPMARDIAAEIERELDTLQTIPAGRDQVSEKADG